MKQYTIDMIKREHNGHFFSKDTMRVWRSRVLEEVYQGDGGIFFVTSDRPDRDHPRMYTVREFNPDTKEINTVTEHHPKTGYYKYTSDTKYLTIRNAKDLANG